MIVIKLPNHFEQRATEWLMAVLMASFGFILLLAPHIFESPHMIAMQEIAPQSVWGLGSFISGLVHLTVLYVNGEYRKSPHWRAACSGIGVVFWWEITLGVYGTRIPSMGMAIYPWLVAFNVYNVVRAMRDARRYDDGIGVHGS